MTKSNIAMEAFSEAGSSALKDADAPLEGVSLAGRMEGEAAADPAQAPLFGGAVSPEAAPRHSSRTGLSPTKSQRSPGAAASGADATSSGHASDLSPGNKVRILMAHFFASSFDLLS